MKKKSVKAWGVLLGVFVSAALLAATASGRVSVQTGDSCTASGTGTQYALSIDIPSTGPEQYGFAFGAGAVTVMNATIRGAMATGTFSKDGLPQQASGAWITPTPLQPGTAVANLVTSSPVKGSFSVVPASAAQPQAAFFEPIVCTVVPAAPAPSTKFTVGHPTYAPSSHGWRLSVTIPAAGRVTAVQPEPTIGTAYPKGVKTTKPLVVSRGVGLKSPGTVTLILKPTAAGQSVVGSNGSLKLRLEVTFAPNGGQSASKLMTVTLRK